MANKPFSSLAYGALDTSWFLGSHGWEHPTCFEQVVMVSACYGEEHMSIGQN